MKNVKLTIEEINILHNVLTYVIMKNEKNMVNESISFPPSHSICKTLKKKFKEAGIYE